MPGGLCGGVEADRVRRRIGHIASLRRKPAAGRHLCAGAGLAPAPDRGQQPVPFSTVQAPDGGPGILRYYRAFQSTGRPMKTIAYGLSAVLCLGCVTAGAADLVNDEQKTLYAIGVALSQSVKDFALTEAELELVKSGMTDGVLGRPSRVEMQTYGPKIQQLAQARASVVARKEEKASAAFLAKAAGESGTKKTASGALVRMIKDGKGPSPAATDTVKVHYQGTLTDGTVFDSSIQRGAPATFPLNRVIKCWTEGVQEIKVGGKARLVCPANIAYGDRGSPPNIKPGATLVFEVELLEIVKEAK
jgi:FKBP-type peptidyl-prolyl cis-trans isomerase FkpA/FKBP-type peptidyl-prolyl cis-trans isomerase FklB